MNVSEVVAKMESEYSGCKNSHGVILMPKLEDKEKTRAIEDAMLDTEIKRRSDLIERQNTELFELKCEAYTKH